MDILTRANQSVRTSTRVEFKKLRDRYAVFKRQVRNRTAKEKAKAAAQSCFKLMSNIQNKKDNIMHVTI